jgi:predicted AAA+ superfamily ATPase
VFTTTNWSPTEETRQRRGRKLYFRDPAVRNAALLRGLDTLSTEEWGLLYENLAASHLQSLAAAENVRLAHWRDRNAEVDVIYDHPSRPLSFEVGSHKHARTGLRRLLERHPELHGRSWVVLKDAPWRSAQDDPEGIGTIDLPSFLWVVSRQIARAMLDRFR